MDERHFFSHTTAARILGLPLARAHATDAHLHVSIVSPFRAPKGRGVVGHQLCLNPAFITSWDDLRIPVPGEVWAQLASVLTVAELVQVGDALTRRESPLANVEQLREVVERAGHRPGVGKLREAVELVRPRTDSPMETLLRLALVAAGLEEPKVNAPIADAVGRPVALGDLVFADQRLVVEYDGDQHRHDPAQYANDINRLWQIEQLGWRVIRINSTHMTNGAREAVFRVRAALERR